MDNLCFAAGGYGEEKVVPSAAFAAWIWVSLEVDPFQAFLEPLDRDGFRIATDGLASQVWEHGHE